MWMSESVVNESVVARINVCSIRCRVQVTRATGIHDDSSRSHALLTLTGFVQVVLPCLDSKISFVVSTY